MSAILDTLLQEQGDSLAGSLSDLLGVARKDAARALPATVNVILERFEPGTCGRWGADPKPVEVPENQERYLDAILAGTGLELSERLGAGVGIAPEHAVRAIPVLVPEILRFILRQASYGSLACSVLCATVATQGQGSLEALAYRLAERVDDRPAGHDRTAPGFAKNPGRWEGKWSPDGGH